MSKLTHKILLQLRKLLLLIFKFTLRGLFGVYSYISYMMGGGKCRFYPSCSSYSYQAIVKYGIFKGLYLTLHRILRCHPFSKGGYDPLK